MATFSPVYRLWRNEAVLSTILTHLDTTSICSLRLTDFECCELTTPTLFARTCLTFTPSSFTRPSRLEALARIGHHIQHLTFSMPHTDLTFLPPLLNPMTGQEFNFLYTPQTSGASIMQRPKYGSPELGDVLTQQYPPIFHAATNVPAFINAFSLLPNLRHLTVSCPGQDPAQRYRRDAVDYALISLRMAIERAPLLQLNKLSLSRIHPSGLVYLRHMPGFGCTPSSGRRWRQIKKLYITMDSWDFLGLRPGLDHLKILDDYIRSLSPTLEKVSFGWNGWKGPCPFTLFTDPLFAPPRTTAKLFAEVTSPMSPLPAAPPRPSMTFPNLQYMQVRNATMSSEQVSEFVYEHRHTVREFDFENVFLINDGNWEDALAPLADTSSNEEWLSQLSGSESGYSSYPSQDEMDQFDQLDEPEVVDSFVALPSEINIPAPLEIPRMSVHMTKQKKSRRHRRRKRKHNHIKPEPLAISDPITIIQPIEDLLKPTVFNPNIQGVQRNVEQEAAQQELADDPEKRVSTLKKAKEAVLRQLGREFSKTQERKDQVKDLWKNTCSGSAYKKGRSFIHESNTALVPLMFSRY